MTSIPFTGESGCRRIVLQRQLKKSGIIQVDLHLLSGARHDIFHESALGCSMQAADLIKTWIKHISIL